MLLALQWQFFFLLQYARYYDILSLNLHLFFHRRIYRSKKERNTPC